MDPVVTARVPEAVRDRANEVLRSIGATPSQLINAAYEYVIREGRLPSSAKAPEDEHRELTPDIAAEIDAFLGRTRLPDSLEWDGTAFKEMYDETMEYRNAHLY